MKNILTLRSLLLVAAFTVISLIISVQFSQRVGASAPPGLQATIASTSQITVGPTVAALPIVGTSTCSSRIVSTGPQAVLLTMSDRTGQVPSGIFGYTQAASTTVAYDSGLYGCGALRAYGAGGATSVITVSDVQ